MRTNLLSAAFAVVVASAAVCAAPIDELAQLQQAAQAYHLPNEKQARLQVLALADAGNPFAAMMVERAYRKGSIGFAKDPDAAARYAAQFDRTKMMAALQRGANRRQVDALNWLGNYYRDQESTVDQAKAVQWFAKAAEAGHTDAMIKMAAFYLEGKGGLAVDEKKAFDWYEKSANGGNADGIYALGWAYQYGKGIAKDDAKAVQWYTKAAEAGHTRAMVNLAAYYLEGKGGLTVDEKKAFDWYEKSANGGNANGIYALGWAYQYGKGIAKDDAKAVQWFAKAAEAGHTRAMVSLAAYYLEGKGGLTVDEKKAFDWYEKSANGGDADGIYALGWAYQYGKGVAKDEVKAVQWYTKAAEAGNAQGMNNLGWMYREGKGIAKDDVKAAQWYTKAAEAGNAQGMNNLGWMHKYGKGIVKDEAKAVQWYTKSAEAGNIDGMVNLGVMYANGTGIAKDEVKAVQWYTKAAEAGDANAQTKLGYAYEKGQGHLSIDLKKAVEWYKKSAEGGYDYGMVNLGYMYIYGTGTPKDPKKGMEWIEKAAALGSEHAIKKLTELKEKGSNNGTEITVGDAVGAPIGLAAGFVLGRVGLQDVGLAAGALVKTGIDTLLPNGRMKLGQSVKQDTDGAARVIMAAYQQQPKDSTRAIFYKSQLEQYLQSNKIKDKKLQKEIKGLFAVAPILQWVQTPNPSTNHESIQLTVRLQDQGSGIGDVRLLVNGAVIDQSSRAIGRAQQGIEQTFDLKLSKRGQYQIRIEAYNAENLGVPAVLDTSIESTYQTSNKPKLHAVVVGIDQYKNSSLQLNYAVSDADAIYATLQKQVGGLYDAGQMTLLTTPTQTSKASIESALKAIKQQANLEDVFVFYVASHGISYEGAGYYMLTSDVLQTSQERVAASSFAAEQLQNLIAQIGANKKLILLDTCNSGGALNAQKLMTSRGMEDQNIIERMRRKSGATVMMASESSEQAREGYQGHGLFTYTLLQGLAGQSDFDKDGLVDSHELTKYVEDTVPKLAEQRFKTTQTPFVSTNGQGLTFKTY